MNLQYKADSQSSLFYASFARQIPDKGGAINATYRSRNKDMIPSFASIGVSDRGISNIIENALVHPEVRS